MSYSLNLLWRLAALAVAGAAGCYLLSARPRQQATLGRLVALDSCLAANNRLTAKAAAGTLASIAYYVARNRNQASDRAVLRQAQYLQATTQPLLDTLRQLRRGWPATGTPAALARLAAHLNQFTDSLRVFVPETASLTRASPGRAAAGWFGEVDLRTLPAPAARAALTRLETQVRQVLAAALAAQAVKVGSECICFDKVGAFATAVSNTVAPGGQYEGRLMLSHSASGVRVSLRANGRELVLDPRTNHGLVTLRVPPARAGQPDTVRAAWQGEIHFDPSGIDSTVRLTVPYLIVKPPQP